jgi:hypothetical protein
MIENLGQASTGYDTQFTTGSPLKIPKTTIRFASSTNVFDKEDKGDSNLSCDATE